LFSNRHPNGINFVGGERERPLNVNTVKLPKKAFQYSKFGSPNIYEKKHF